MQDSFDSRMKGNSPVSTKSNSDKGWMFCSIALLVILIGAGVFGGIIIAKGNRDTNRLSEVEQQLKEKEAKIEELEKANGDTVNEPAADPDGSQGAPGGSSLNLTVDYAKLQKLVGNGTITPLNIEYSADDEYLVVIADVAETNGGFAGVWYKSTAAGSSWKELEAGHQAGACSNYSDAQKELMNKFKTLDDKLGSDYIGCYESDGSFYPR